MISNSDRQLPLGDCSRTAVGGRCRCRIIFGIRTADAVRDREGLPRICISRVVGCLGMDGDSVTAYQIAGAS
ncbi:hypothetical protein SDC9_174034 [bioreactor metagenome]|uniref:Uncharacterized protein n=1 Tax=bioreactor metagenome TaxID=1076179 RepID=A0A645GL78_9ZZZZ